MEVEATDEPIHRGTVRNVADAGLMPTGPRAGARVNILGPVEVQAGVEGRPAQPVPGRNARALLAALAARGGRPVRREALIADLWGNRSTGTTDNLRLAVMRLRSGLAALDEERGRFLVATVPDGYRLALDDPLDLDTHRFERLLEEARALASSGEVAPARGRVDDALALWRGDPLPELAGTQVGDSEAARLRDLRETALDLHFELALLAGDHTSLPAQIEAALADQPYREHRWGQLMVALYRCGRQADALAAYQRVRLLLAEDLGLEPGADLRRLEASVLAQDPALGWEPRPSAGPSAPQPASTAWIAKQRELPLVGRRDPLDRLWAGWHRVIERSSGGVALVEGDAGVGKTRLAAELADGVLRQGARVVTARCVRGAGLASLVPALDELGIPVEPAPLVPGSPALVGVARRVAHELTFGPVHQPTLLVLEDAQWLDEQMVAVFGDLGDRPWPVVNANPNLVLVLIQRGWPMPTGTPRMMDAIDHLAWQDHVVLDRLGDGEARALVAEAHRSRSGTSPLSDSTIDEIVAASGGNARALIELARTGVGPTVPGATAALGETLRHSFAERLDGRPTAVVDVVLAAAIIGQELDLHALGRASDLDDDQALASLEAAVAARLLDEVPERAGHFRFLNRVDRQLALARVSLTRRQLVETRLGRT